MAIKNPPPRPPSPIKVVPSAQPVRVTRSWTASNERAKHVGRGQELSDRKNLGLEEEFSPKIFPRLFFEKGGERPSPIFREKHF